MLEQLLPEPVFFDDSIVFNSNGTYDHYMDGATWLESWQAGSPAEGCGAPIAPHDGGSNTYTFSNGVLTVSGVGAHVGLAKVHNGGEDGAPVNDQITYSVTFSGSNSEIMTVDISFPNAGGTNGLGWWRFVYLKNDAACATSVAPTNENFDAGFSVCWSQESNDDFDWTIDANGTGSGGTGPSDDFTGGGNYMYTEASVPRAHGDTATMYSEVIDISGLTNPELRFLNHMYGSAIGTLSVDLWDASTGTNLSTVFTHSGDRGDQWNEELIMLSTTATTIQFSITAVLDTNAAGQAWPGDIAIDEFGVREAIANDLSLVAAAVASGCDLTATEPIELWVVNQGLVAESAFRSFLCCKRWNTSC